MTVRDLPLADATPETGVDSPRASARARARLAATLRNRKPPMWVLRIRADAAGWWLVTSEPMPLRSWWRTLRPEIARVPEDNTVLLLLWALDNWTTGLLTRLASLVLYGVAGAIGWLSGHPVRRWAAITLATAYVAWITAT